MSYAGSHGDPNPSTPAFANTHDWIYYYLVIHQLSSTHVAYYHTCNIFSDDVRKPTAPSYRYAYLLWFSIILLVLVFGTIDLVTGSGMNFGTLSAWWHKWSIQRPSFFTLSRRKSYGLRRTEMGVLRSARKVRKPAWWKIKSSPSPVYGELFALFVLAVAVALACVLGPDYIKPTTSTFGFVHDTKRRLSDWLFGVDVDRFTSRDYKINPVSPPGYTIHKAWWTAGGRTGNAHFDSLGLSLRRQNDCQIYLTFWC